MTIWSINTSMSEEMRSCVFILFISIQGWNTLRTQLMRFIVFCSMRKTFQQREMLLFYFSILINLKLLHISNLSLILQKIQFQILETCFSLQFLKFWERNVKQIHLKSQNLWMQSSCFLKASPPLFSLNVQIQSPNSHQVSKQLKSHISATWICLQNRTIIMLDQLWSTESWVWKLNIYLFLKNTL